MHYVYFTTNPLFRAGRIDSTTWVLEKRSDWQSADWRQCFDFDRSASIFTLEKIEEMVSSPQG
jgi:hypothetical protein